MSSLMIVEPDATGHRMQYVRRIAREARRRGVPVQLLTRAISLEHPAYRAMQAELQDGVETQVLAESPRARRLIESGCPVRSRWGYHRLFAAHFRRLPASQRPGAVFVPFLDHCDKIVALLGSPFGSTPWSGLVMGYTFHAGRMGALLPGARSDALDGRLLRRLLQARGLRRLFTIDPLLHAHVQRSQPQLAARLQYVGDPVDMEGSLSRPAARARFGIPEEAVVLLVYGSLTPRKGIDALLAAAREESFPGAVSLLLAGSQQAGTPALLAGPAAQALRAQGRVYERDGFLSDEEEYAAFKAADIVWIGYREFYGMSGVLIQAGRMELPVVACREGLVGWMTRQHGLGLDVDLDQTQEVAGAIARLAGDRALAAACGENGARLARSHTGRAFGRSICDAVLAGGKR